MNFKKIFTMFTVILVGIILTGCGIIQAKVEENLSDKEECVLNTDNVTQFIYKSNSYTILENTYSNESLGDWVGYIRKVVAVNDDGKILEQNSMDKSIFNFRSDLDESASVISFLNVYTDSDDTDYLIVDVNEGHHKAILTEKITTQDTIFDFTSLKHESLSNQFKINPENATQLICNDTVYQVTSETVSDSELGNYITAVAEQITFDSDTKKPLSKDELNSIDWFGKDSKKRDFWVYSDIYEISGIAVTEAVAVKINNQYYKAEVK